MELDQQKERYIEQARREGLNQSIDSDSNELTERIQFWQSLTTLDRMNATSEIFRRVHLAKGGQLEDLRVKRNIAEVVRRTR